MAVFTSERGLGVLTLLLTGFIANYAQQCPEQTTYFSTTSTEASTTEPSTTEDPKCIEIVSRTEWEAGDIALKDIPVPSIVFIHHTEGSGCCSRQECIARVKEIQRDHQARADTIDIGYSFLIGGDAKVYEGRGWQKDGAHVPGYNNRSLGISFIGSYTNELPSDDMITSAQNLIACGVEMGHLSTNYTLYGHFQGSATDCPKLIYNAIQTWENWSPEWIYNTNDCDNVNGKCQDSTFNTAAICPPPKTYVNNLCPGPAFVQCCKP